MNSSLAPGLHETRAKTSRREEMFLTMMYAQANPPAHILRCLRVLMFRCESLHPAGKGQDIDFPASALFSTFEHKCAGHREIFTPLPSSRVHFPNRSEERRVGKECRSRWSPYH